jgi:hypothetical protein
MQISLWQMANLMDIKIWIMQSNMVPHPKENKTYLPGTQNDLNIKMRYDSKYTYN